MHNSKEYQSHCSCFDFNLVSNQLTISNKVKTTAKTLKHNKTRFVKILYGFTNKLFKCKHEAGLDLG